MVAEHNSGKNEKFSERSERRMQGRPRKSPDHNVVDLIHRFVRTGPHPNLLAIRENYCTHLTKRLRLRYFLGFGKDRQRIWKFKR